MKGLVLDIPGIGKVMALDPTALLGRILDAQLLAELAPCLGGPPETADDENTDEIRTIFRAGGVEILSSSEAGVHTVFLFGPGNADGLEPYSGRLPMKAGFSWSRERVQQTLGLPTRSGQGRSILKPGEVELWDRYDGPGACLHFRYAESGAWIVQVTVMSPERAP